MISSGLLIQVILNVLGTVDVLPLTGVTFPFLSNGGTSMIGAWGLLAFVKAADTRQNASFAVRLRKQGRDEDEPQRRSSGSATVDGPDAVRHAGACAQSAE